MPTKRIRREIRALKASEPGMRFIEANGRHQIRRHSVRVVVISFGVLLMAGAAATFWLPGPQFLLVMLGLAIVGGQSERTARAIDRLELHARSWHERRWVPMSRWKKRLAIFLMWLWGMSVALGISWYTWLGAMLPESWPIAR